MGGGAPDRQRAGQRLRRRRPGHDRRRSDLGHPGRPRRDRAPEPGVVRRPRSRLGCRHGHRRPAGADRHHRRRRHLGQPDAAGRDPGTARRRLPRRANRLGRRSAARPAAGRAGQGRSWRDPHHRRPRHDLDAAGDDGRFPLEPPGHRRPDAGGGYGLFSTHDGGGTWAKQAFTLPALDAVSFSDATHGWVSHSMFSVVCRTDDGGRTWVGSDVRGGYKGSACTSS